MNNELNNPNRRPVTATMYRGKSKEVIMVRRYRYFDTAMPRMVQLAISQANEGDFVEFVHDDYGGIQIGILRILPEGKFEMEMNPIVKSSPAFLKLMSEDRTSVNNLIKAAMKR